MTVKYHCPKCQRRFVDWGAQKLEFHCPDCKEDLVLVGGTTGKTKSKPSLRRNVGGGDGAPRRVTSFDDEEEVVKVPVGAAADEEFEAVPDAAPGFDDDDAAEIDIAADDDEIVEVDDSED